MKYWLSGIVLVVLGLLAWYFYSNRPAVVEEAPVATPPPVVQEAPPPPPRQVEPSPPELPAAPEAEVEELPLPPLATSDPEANAAAAGLVGAEAASRYLVSEAVIPKFVATVDVLDGRKVPPNLQAVAGPAGSFEANVDPDPPSVIRNEVGDPIPQFVIDPVNYQRYTPYVEMLEEIEPAEAAATLERYQPLLDEAFRQLGYPDGDFGQRLRSIIDELLATPDVDGPVRLIKPEAYYLFADEELEALSAGQKILLRMGPDNAARVKARLALIRETL
jgi:hypothetical protein